MTIKIRRPTVGSVVDYTSEIGSKHVGTIIGVKENDVVSVRDIDSPWKVYHTVHHDDAGASETWRYVNEEIEVER